MIITLSEQINLPEFTIEAQSTAVIYQRISRAIPCNTPVIANAVPILPDGVFFTGCYVCPQTENELTADEPTSATLAFSFGNLRSGKVTVAALPLPSARVLIECTFYDESAYREHRRQIEERSENERNAETKKAGLKI